MFFPDELRGGAKRAVLEYLAVEDGDIPLPETQDISEAGPGTLLRSDTWREFDRFPGVFESVLIGEDDDIDGLGGTVTLQSIEQALDFINFRKTGNKCLDARMEWRRKNILEPYCAMEGLEVETVLADLEVLPQRLVRAEKTGIVFQHPHIKERYFVYMPLTCGLWADYDGTRFEPVMGEFNAEQLSGDILLESGFFIDEESVVEKLDLYRRVTGLSRFDDGNVYLMEITHCPTVVTQLRLLMPFRQAIDKECPWRDENGAIGTRTVFGITSPEEIILPYCDKTSSFGTNLLREGWDEKFHRFDSSHPEGYVYREAGETYVKAFFPNAKAVLGGNLAHSISHGQQDNMSRLSLYLHHTKWAARHLDFSTGDHLRIFSNGKEAYARVETARAAGI